MEIVEAVKMENVAAENLEMVLRMVHTDLAESSMDSMSTELQA